MSKKPKTFKTKLYRSVRAISPVISVLLMIAIAVVASLVAYAWVTGFIGGTTTDAGNQIQIQSTTYTSDDYKFLMVYVQNTGQGTVHLKQDSSVYVNDALRTITHSPQGTSIATGAKIPITPGQTVEIVTDYKMSPGERVKIKIVTVEGTVMEFNGKPSEQTTPISENRYNLNVNVVGSGSVSKSPNQPIYASGQVVQLVPSAQRGWQFSQWSGDLLGSANPGSITMDSAKSVTATFTQIAYTLSITYSGTGSGTVTPSRAGPYHLGDQIQLTATPTGSDIFVGWSGDASGTNPTTSVTIDETPEVTATFVTQATQYSLTVTSNPANGGQVNVNPAGPYINGQSVTLTPQAATGYTFTGWSGDLSGNANPGQVTITKNTVITANFALSQVSLLLTANPSYAGFITANPAGPYHFGDVVQITAVPNTPFDFSNWGQDIAGSTNPISITLNSNKAVTALFVPKEYTLDLQQLGEGTVTKTPDKATYHFGDSVTLIATPADGWAFAGWTGDKTSSQLQIQLTIDENPAVLATFTQQQFSLTVRSNPEAGGPVHLNNTGPVYYYDDVVELTANPVYGYHFVNWEGDLTGTTTPATIVITGNMIVTANFAPDPVTLTVNISPTDSGIVNQEPTGPYVYETTVKLTAVPKPGFAFSGWTGEITSTTNPVEVTLYGDTTVTANFEPIEYTVDVTITPASGGTVTFEPSKSTYHLGESVTLTAHPAQGYTFAGWSQDASGTTATVTIAIDENPQVTAVFSAIPYTLTTTANPAAGGSIQRNATEPYTYGQKVQLTAVPATGYRFTGWTSAITGTTNPATVTITGNMVVNANFEAIDVLLTLNVNPSGVGAITANFTGPYHYGDNVRLTAVVINNAYEFSSWSQGATGTANPITLTLTADTTITANFNLKPTQTILELGFDNPNANLWDLGWNDWGNPPWGRADGEGIGETRAAKSMGAVTLVSESFGGTWPPTSWTENPTTSNWVQQNNQAYFSGAGQGSSGYLATGTLDCSDAGSITIAFWYRGQVSSNSEFQLQLRYGPGQNDWDTINVGATGSGGAYYQRTFTDSRYFDSTFSVRWYAYDVEGEEYVYVDDVTITKEIQQYQPGPFTSDSMNMLGATRIIVSFDYKLSQTLSANNFQIYYSGSPGSGYDASRMTTYASLGNSAAGTWIHYEAIIENPAAFTSSFRFGFLSQNMPNDATVWVDNIAILKQIN